MRYFSKPPDKNIKVFGETYISNNQAYTYGTLFKIKDYGLVIIQQYYIKDKKYTYWGPVEYWIANAIYSHKDFLLLFKTYSATQSKDGYPTITVRHAMNWLKIKPLKKQPWETVFDRTII